MVKNNHKYIHFVDFSNINVSLCDPYCVGLLKQHMLQKRKCFYDASHLPQTNFLDTHPCILNRFFLDKINSPTSNFSLYSSSSPIDKRDFDKKYIQNFVSHQKNMKFSNLNLKGNHDVTNTFIPMDTYVPLDYFTESKYFLEKYNIATK